MMKLFRTVSIVLVLCCCGILHAQGIRNVNHVIVIYLENHSFDNLYGKFEGANGLQNALTAALQCDTNGVAYTSLPFDPKDPNFIEKQLPNKPFEIDNYVAWDALSNDDVVHSYYEEQLQIDGSKMDKFVAYNTLSSGYSMGYYNTDRLPLAKEAKDYVLCDRFFHSAFGGSFLNHIYFIAAAPPIFPNAPKKILPRKDSKGQLIGGRVTPDGFAINTLQPFTKPFQPGTPDSLRLPLQKMKTIGDLLNDAKVDWAWYSGGWNEALMGKNTEHFQYHHQPFGYFENYADGTEGRRLHLKDEQEFIDSALHGTLPAVSFVKPVGDDNEHPHYATVKRGELHVDSLVNAIRNGPNWKDCLIIITYDEHGGFWDHVAPPKIDRWGPGSRVPCILISPFQRRRAIDHTQYETESILAFIEKRWHLPSLSKRDRDANPFTNAYQF